MDISIGAKGTARTPRPFRSHRTFRTSFGDGVLTVGALIVGLYAAYAVVLYAWAPCMHLATLAAASAGAVPIAADRYLGIAYEIPLPAMPAIDAIGALWVTAACALAVLASALLPGKRTPLRYWLNANALVLGGSALYAFFHGTVGYDAAPFMTLVGRTGLLTMVAAVPFMTVVSALLPLTFFERIVMMACGLAFEVVVCTVRVAAFALFLHRFGSIPQANLYIFAGPLLDVAYFLAVYSVTVSIAGKRLARTEGAWKWL